ncbi:MAG TPA: peptide deformylase [Solirubrobacteraceae bacterium]|jgi:peptide deformylase|nr:peptide deformylase [Solirubrobacteraceae bacterium]
MAEELLEDEETTAAEQESAEERERREAALAQIRQLGDPVLRTRALEVTTFDARLREDVDRMRAIMDGAVGIGLAATQIGTLARVLVYRVEAESPTMAVINPRIEWSGEEKATMEEGCLSIPGVRVDVERPLHIRVGSVDEYGDARTIEASGLEARVLAHEIDHLDGVLMLDRVDKAQRREAMRTWRERQRGEE